MKNKYSPSRNSYSNVPRRDRASARIVLLVTLAFALGVGGGAILFYGKSGKPTAIVQTETSANGLSSASLSVLTALKGAVEIHYYAILDPSSTSADEKEFANRIGQLLEQYEAAADGKLTIIRYDISSDMGPQSAAKDGIAPFNLDKGDACYLGVAVLGNDQKETFARLSPDWEGALESDLSRAIARVSNPKAASTVASIPTGPGLAVINEVKAALPNLGDMTAEEGAQALRESAMKKAQAALEDMRVQLQKAQQRLADARQGGSEAEQQAALKEFQKLQAEQSRQLQEITGRLQEQIEALNLIKSQ